MQRGDKVVIRNDGRDRLKALKNGMRCVVIDMHGPAVYLQSEDNPRMKPFWWNKNEVFER